MKKIYLLFFAVGFLAASAFAQQRIVKRKGNEALISAPQSNVVSKTQPSVYPMGTIDTLTSHFDLTAGDTKKVPSYVSAQGFVAGLNDYMDAAHAQKFDAAYGVTSDGTISSILFWYSDKIQDSGTATFTATIWDDTGINGMPGVILGEATAFTIADIDTNLAAFSMIGSPSAPRAMYNKVATFNPPIDVPSNHIFWAGVSYVYGTGDFAGLATSSDPTQDAPGTTGDFPDAITHTGELYGTDWLPFNDPAQDTWALDVAMGIYPVVDLGLSVNEQNPYLLSLVNMPNPASDVTTIKYEIKKSSDVIVSVTDITGKELFSFDQGTQNAGTHTVKLDVSQIPNGMYFYSLKAEGYQTTKKMTVAR